MRPLKSQRPPLTLDTIRTKRQEDQVVSVRHQFTSGTIKSKSDLTRGKSLTGNVNLQ